MNHLEEGLHNHFANLAQNAASAGRDTVPQSPELGDNSMSGAGMLGTPFAKVNSVVSGSPADQAGLKAGDTVRNFGSVNWINHERLSKVAEAVQQNEGVCHALIMGIQWLMIIARSDRQDNAQGGRCSGGCGGDGSTADTAAGLGRTGTAGLPSCSAVTRTLGGRYEGRDMCMMYLSIGVIQELP
jgi:hypothetical protein